MGVDIEPQYVFGLRLRRGRRPDYEMISIQGAERVDPAHK